VRRNKAEQKRRAWHEAMAAVRWPGRSGAAPSAWKDGAQNRVDHRLKAEEDGSVATMLLRCRVQEIQDETRASRGGLGVVLTTGLPEFTARQEARWGRGEVTWASR
jgi:hypothetical protein